MTPLYHPRPERWPQVSLKGLFFVATLSAMLTPWLVSEYRHWKFQAGFGKVMQAIEKYNLDGGLGQSISRPRGRPPAPQL